MQTVVTVSVTVGLVVVAPPVPDVEDSDDVEAVEVDCPVVVGEVEAVEVDCPVVVDD